VWVYKGEVMPKGEAQAALPSADPTSPEEPAAPKRAKKPVPRPAGRRSPAKNTPEGETKKPARPRTAKKDDSERASKPKTTVKRTRKPAAKESDAAAPDEGKKE
jgi:hypothetical protein